jgi:ubiquinone/menaquinone biosynthesis C-methylase UbiE
MADNHEPSGTPGTIRPRGGEDFDSLYTGAPPPWDINRPQPALLELANSGLLTGRVLDVGCGTGEHALMAAALGHDAYGIDMAVRAIEIARRKAADQKLAVDFAVCSALELPSLNQMFETVLDSGLFHVFVDEDRARFAASLGAVMQPGGRYYMLSFSDRQPGDWGPRRVSEREIRATFADGWRVESVVPAQMALTIGASGALAWVATITRL